MKKRLLVSIIFLMGIAVVFAQDNAPQGKEAKSILEAIRLQDVLVIWFAGMLGGFANSLLASEGWKPTLIPNLLLGGIAALIIYFLGGDELTPPKQIGAALLSGIGGSNIITRLKQQINQRQAIATLSEATDQLSKFVETITKATEEGGENNETNEGKDGNQESETGNHR